MFNRKEKKRKNIWHFNDAKEKVVSFIKKTYNKSYIVSLKKKKKKLYGPFLWMGFNCLKARATSRRQFTFYH